MPNQKSPRIFPTLIKEKHMVTFKSLKLKGWRQFKSIEINLDRQVTILTGQNSSGKTTLLNLLGRHFGWNINFISTPYISKKSQKKLWSDVLQVRKSEIVEDQNNDNISIGSIEYSDDSVCELSTPTYVTAQYQLQFNGQQSVIGLSIPSHRPAISYQQILDIPTMPKTRQQHYQDFQQLLFQTYNSPSVQNPGIILKKSLLSLAIFGFGSEAVVPNKEYKELFLGFQQILRKLLPLNLGFKKLEIRMPDIVLITKTGQFSLDAMSGGINDIISIAWQIHMFGSDKDDCTVLIDEPENHLHPSMQRSILPSLAKAFPKYKFIVSSHSPIIVTSMPEAGVYGLIYNKNNKVYSIELTEAELAGTPNSTLRNILEVPSNLPIWVEERIKTVIKSTEALTGEKRVEVIFNELDKLGFSDKISEIDID